MMRSPMAARVLWCASLLVLLPFATYGDEKNDDFQFAEALASKLRYFDLAEKIYKDIINDGMRSAEERAQGSYGLAKLKKIHAETEGNVDAKLALIDEAIHEVNGYLSKVSDPAMKTQVKNDVADLYTTKARTLAFKAKNDLDPKFLADAEKAFVDATAKYQDVIGEMERSRNPADKDWIQRYGQAKYFYMVSLFNHADLYKDDKKNWTKMKDILAKLDKDYQSYMWDYEDYLFTYDLAIYIGRAYVLLATISEDDSTGENYMTKAMGNFAFGLAISLVEKEPPAGSPPFKDERNGLYDVIKEITSKAYLNLIKSYVTYGGMKKKAGTKYYQMAINAANKVFALYPKCLKEEDFQEILIEQGRAYCLLDNVPKAKAILKELTENNDVRNRLANKAKELLLSYGGSIPLSQRLEAAESLYKQNFIDKSLDEFLRIAGELKTPDEQKEFPHIMFRIGECFSDMGRYHEAITAFNYFTQPEWKGYPDAGPAASKRLKLLGKLKNLTKAPYDEAAYKTAREFLQKNYPQNAGDLWIESGDEAFANKEYLKASGLYGKVTVDKPVYEEALFFTAYGFYKYTTVEPDIKKLSEESIFRKNPNPPKEEVEKEKFLYLQKSLEAFTKYLSYASTLEKAKQEDKDIGKRRAGALNIVVDLYLTGPQTIRDPKKALEYAQKMEKIPNVPLANAIGIKSLTILATIAVGDLETAEKLLKAFMAKHADKTAMIAEAQLSIAKEYDSQALALKDKDPKRSETLAGKAAEYYVEWASDTANLPKIKAGDFKIIGDKAYYLATISGNEKHYKMALDMYEGYRLKAQEVEAQNPMTPEQKFEFLRKLAKCYLLTGKFKEAEEIYADPAKLNAADPTAPQYLQDELADIFIGQANTAATPQERLRYYGKAMEIFNRLRDVYKNVIDKKRDVSPAEMEKLEDNMWRYAYRYAELRFLRGDYKDLWTFFDIWETIYPDFGGKGDYKKKFEELKRQLQEKSPRAEKPKEEGPKEEKPAEKIEPPK